MFTTRKPRQWKCQLMGEDSSTVQATVIAHWDPDKVTAESMAQIAAAMQTVACKHKTRYHGLSAQLAEA